MRSCAAADGALGPGAIRSGSLATATWHFTDRGIAAILVLAAMILTSALLVVGLTAVHVTGEGYQPISPGQSILAPR